MNKTIIIKPLTFISTGTERHINQPLLYALILILLMVHTIYHGLQRKEHSRSLTYGIFEGRKNISKVQYKIF